MRKIILLMCVLGLVFGLSGCEEGKTSADKVQAKQTAEAMNEAQRQVGMPNIINFQQRKLMSMIFELCDKED